MTKGTMLGGYLSSSGIYRPSEDLVSHGTMTEVVADFFLGNVLHNPELFFTQEEVHENTSLAYKAETVASRIRHLRAFPPAGYILQDTWRGTGVTRVKQYRLVKGVYADGGRAALTENLLQLREPEEVIRRLAEKVPLPKLQKLVEELLDGHVEELLDGQ